MKKFWFGMAGLGVIVFIAGLILTIVLINETGEEVPDSECSSTMRAGLLATCVVSDDPKVLLGVAPLLLGVAMVGIGIWRGIVTPSSGDSGDDSDGDSGGGLFGSLQELQDKAIEASAVRDGVGHDHATTALGGATTRASARATGPAGANGRRGRSGRSLRFAGSTRYTTTSFVPARKNDGSSIASGAHAILGLVHRPDAGDVSVERDRHPVAGRHAVDVGLEERGQHAGQIDRVEGRPVVGPHRSGG